MQQFLMGLTAHHESERYYRDRFGDPVDPGKRYPSAEHPVVRTHPETGRPALYVNSMFTTRIEQLTPEESESILRFLLHHVESPYYQTRFKWSEDDVAVWDNRCAQHRAIWDYRPHKRTGHRVSVRGLGELVHSSPLAPFWALPDSPRSSKTPAPPHCLTP
jgi:taurine dioxygenase